MTDEELLERKAPATVEGTLDRDGSLWAIVLAGGEGVRLRSLVRGVCGDERPKQYVPLLESRTLLQQTLDRVGRLVPAARTVIVTMQWHAPYLRDLLDGSAGPHVLAQPEDRGTAAGVLLPAHWIQARDPRATVIVVPSDHFVREEALFMAHVAAVERFVREHREWMVLLGAQPTEPETDYGWIEAGGRAGWTADGPLYRVERFWEKPSNELAAGLFARGCLWNTLVLTAGVSTLIEAGWECLPELHGRLARLAAFAGTEHEAWAIRQAYAFAPRANFSRAVLQCCPGSLAVSRVPGLTWCDLGSPARVLKAVTTLDLAPSWLGKLSTA